MRPARFSRDQGSTLIETALWSALLLMPIAPALLLYQQVSDQLAAESIAVNGLRAALLEPDGDWEARLTGHLSVLAESWGKEISFVELSCGQCNPGDLVTLEVRVGNAIALQSAGIEPK